MEASVVSPARGGGACGYQRLAYLVGAGLILIGLTHAALWAMTGGSASGAVSWRKPTTFGISFGLTTVTLAWVATYLPVRKAIGWTAAGLLGAATTYEVVWVTVQHARGVPAHFNDTTPLDERLFIAGAVMVAVAIGVIAAMTLAAFLHTTAPAPMALAIRGGLVGLLAAQVTGLWMLLHGLALLDADADPLVQSMNTYGAAGSMKFAHAVPMHAIQVLVVLAWLLSLSGLPQRRQTQLVALGVVGYAGLVAVALGRTTWGLAPVDLRNASTLGYLLAAALLAAPAVAVVTARHRRASSPKNEPHGTPSHGPRGVGRRGTAKDSELPQRPRKRPRKGWVTMRIGLTSIYVDDQNRAERFYTEVLGFKVKTSAPYGPTERWLSVVAPEEPDGVELVLHLADAPARAFQAASRQAGRPVLSLRTGDCAAEAERLKARGVVFVKEPGRMPYGGTDAVFDDSCGNLINLHQD
jgi:catechol 2,3-dioxygenase-like lactoylglutathione lyase family enzyme